MLGLYSLSAVQLHDVQVMHDVKELFYKVYSDLFTVARCLWGLGCVVSFHFSFRFLLLFLELLVPSSIWTLFLTPHVRKSHLFDQNSEILSVHISWSSISSVHVHAWIQISDWKCMSTHAHVSHVTSMKQLQSNCGGGLKTWTST